MWPPIPGMPDMPSMPNIAPGGGGPSRADSGASGGGGYSAGVWTVAPLGQMGQYGQLGQGAPIVPHNIGFAADGYGLPNLAAMLAPPARTVGAAGLNLSPTTLLIGAVVLLLALRRRG